jgi:Acyl-CoA carboxylase epsilon subunit
MSDEIRIVRGVPTDEELAAIVGVLFAARTTVAPPIAATASRWARSGRAVASGLGRPGRDAWRASTLPR